jgi:hypothetical protein
VRHFKMPKDRPRSRQGRDGPLTGTDNLVLPRCRRSALPRSSKDTDDERVFVLRACDPRRRLCCAFNVRSTSRTVNARGQRQRFTWQVVTTMRDAAHDLARDDPFRAARRKDGKGRPANLIPPKTSMSRITGGERVIRRMVAIRC